MYAQVVELDFVSCDDSELILKNSERLEKISNIPDEIFTGYMETNYYRPLLNISFLLDYQIGGKEPLVYHIVNLIIHIINCCLLFYVLTLLNFKRMTAMVGALIFTVHPLFANAVAWVVGRNDMLFTLFGLLSFIMLIKNQRAGGKPQFFLLNFLFLFLSVSSKETAVLLPVMFALYLLTVEKTNIITERNIVYAACWAGAIGLWYGMRSASDLGEQVYKTGFDIFFYNIPQIPEYIGKFIIPANLSVLPAYSTFNTAVGVAAIALLAVAVLAAKNKRYNVINFGLLWFLVLIIPGLFMALLNVHEWNEYLECRAYFPMIGILIVLLELIPEKWTETKARNLNVIVVILIAVLSILTFNETQKYKNERTFYESAAADAPDRAMYHFLLHKIYRNDGEYQKAEQELLAAINANPNNPKYHYNTGAFYYRMGKNQRAIKYLDETLRQDSTYKIAYEALGWALFYTQQFDRIKKLLNSYISRWGDNPQIYDIMSGVYLTEGKIDSANMYVDRLIRSKESAKGMYNLYYNWAMMMMRKKQYEDALKLLKKSTDIKPDSLPAYKELFNYYLDIENDIKKARKYAQKVWELGGSIPQEKLKKLESEK